MVEVEDVGDGASPEAMDRVRVMCLVRCRRKIGLLLNFGSGSDVSSMARLRLRITVVCG